MSINPGDFIVSIVPTNPDIDFLECVIGEQLDIEIDFINNSLTDPLYNLGVSLSLPNGISYVGSSISESSNTIDSSFNNIATFINIKDLYPKEDTFKFHITLKVDSFYRGTNLPVPFNSLITGISINANCDTMPRGNFDTGNLIINATSSATLKTFRFSATCIAPESYLKGGGIIPGDNIDATQIFNMSINLANNSRTASNISLLLKLANGLRYIGIWNASGTNSTNFLNPSISDITPSKDHVEISFNNKTLSPGSNTTLQFQVAIWDKYTVNGIENSGNTILYGESLISTILLQGNGSSYSEECITKPLEINISKTVDSDFTDVDVTNEFTLTYQTSEYLSIENVNIVDIIPDGLSYLSSTLTPTSINTISDGTTNILWSVGSLPTNSSSSIKIKTKTKSTYSNKKFIYSTDILNNTLKFSCTKAGTGATINAFAFKKLTIVAPILTKQVTKYYYEDMTPSTYNLASIGSHVGFIISYNAKQVMAKQKNVVLFDYPPLNMKINSIPKDTVISGDFPAGVIPQLTVNNGIRVSLGDLNGGAYFTITFSLPVTDATENGDFYNLSKVQLKNTTDHSTSVRDNALISIGEPHLRINNEVSSNDCIHNGSELTYTINIKNSSDEEINYVTDGFNLVLTSTLPQIYTIKSTPIVTGNAFYSPIKVINNIITLNIDKLTADSELLVTVPLSVESSPIMGQNYNILSNITPGTSQPSKTSYHYAHGDYPLDDESVLVACSPEISKFYSPAVNKLGDYYKTTVITTLPKGVLAYNCQIKDDTLSTNTSYISDTKLNGTTTVLDLSTNNIKALLPETLDTATNNISYTLEYNNRVMSVSPINYEDSRNIASSLDWSSSLNIPELYSKSTISKFTVLTPGIKATKYQSNITQGTSYDIAPIYGVDSDNINYKLTLTNIGKAPAYDVVIVDTIPATLRYNSITGGLATLNNLTNVLTITVPFITTDSSHDIIIDTTIIEDESNNIATNDISLDFKANTNLPDFYGNATSNVVNLIKDTLLLSKYQRNLTAGDSYNTSEIRCIKDQSIQYKVTLKNTSNNSLSNISITDIFPSQFKFVSFEPFTLGTLSVNGNTVTCFVSLLPANATLEFIYTIQLTNDSFVRTSSISTINYQFLGGTDIFTKNSNRVYVVCSTLGRGYMIY